MQLLVIEAGQIHSRSLSKFGRKPAAIQARSRTRPVRSTGVASWSGRGQTATSAQTREPREPQPEVQREAVVARLQPRPGDLLDAVEAVVQRRAVQAECLGRRPGVAREIEICLQRVDE